MGFCQDRASGRAGEEFEEFNGHVLSFLWKLEKDTIAKDEVHSFGDE
jgi:hypothetical protein